MLRSLNVTTIVTEETTRLFGPDVELRVSGISALVDNIVLTEYIDVGTELKRLISIVKQRGAGHDIHVRELLVTDAGVVVAESERSAEQILLSSPPRARWAWQTNAGGRRAIE